MTGDQGRDVGGSAFARCSPIVGWDVPSFVSRARQVAQDWPAGRETPDTAGQQEPLDPDQPLALARRVRLALLGPACVRVTRRTSGILEHRAPPSSRVGREARAFGNGPPRLSTTPTRRLFDKDAPGGAVDSWSNRTWFLADGMNAVVTLAGGLRWHSPLPPSQHRGGNCGRMETYVPLGGLGGRSCSVGRRFWMSCPDSPAAFTAFSVGLVAPRAWCRFPSNTS